MTEQEYLKKKKELLKLLDKSLLKVMKKEITHEEYFIIRLQWTDLMKEVKQQSWFKHI